MKKNPHRCLVNNGLDNPPVKVFAWADTAVKGESIETDKEETKEEEGLLDKITSFFGKDEETDKEGVGKNDEDTTTVNEGSWEE